MADLISSFSGFLDRAREDFAVCLLPGPDADSYDFIPSYQPDEDRSHAQKEKEKQTDENLPDDPAGPGWLKAHADAGHRAAVILQTASFDKREVGRLNRRELRGQKHGLITRILSCSSSSSIWSFVLVKSLHLLKTRSSTITRRRQGRL